MHYNSLALAVAALSSTVAAQTFSKCDPTRGDKCDPNPAFGKCNTAQTFDFTTVDSKWHEDSSFNNWWLPDDGVIFNKKLLSITKDKGAKLSIDEQEQAPLIKSKRYLFYGRVDVTLQAAKGQGVVTSVVLEGDTRDEVDWEWIGGESTNVQTNFFSKGVNEYTQGRTHAVAFAATEGLHTYSIDWSSEKMEFLIDGSLIRTVYPNEAGDGKKWPQNPAQLKLGTWVGGKNTMPEGTIEWAGGLADFKQAPFEGFYQKVSITDYCGGKSSAKEYTYSDSSGTSASINVVEGESKDLASSKSSEPSKSLSYATDIPKFSDEEKSSASAPTTLAVSTTYKESNATSTGTGSSYATGTGSSSDSGHGSGSASGSASSSGSKATTSTSSSASAISTTVTAGAASMGMSYAAVGLAFLGCLAL